MLKLALIVMTSHGQLGDTGKPTGWYLSEVSHVYYPLVEAGYKVEFASTQGGAAPLDPSSLDLNDSENKKFMNDKTIQAALKETKDIDKIDAKAYKIIHFAGGHGTMWDFWNNEGINRATATVYENGGIVSAVCHGPAALVNVKLSNGKYLVDGKDVDVFTDAEEKEVGNDKVVPFLLQSKLKERGAKTHAGKNWSDSTMVSERLVTGQNPQSAASLAKKVVELAKSLK